MSYSLFLFELESVYATHKLDQLKSCLESGEISGHFDADGQADPGDRLMDFINYLGCSPALSSGALEASIKLFSYKTLTGMGAEPIETLRYPRCKHPISNGPALLADLQATARWTCPGCGQQGNADEINWRKSAGYSHYFIEISPIFPREALPSEALLTILQDNTKKPWSWFYSASTR